MIALYIIGGILAFFAIILLSNLRLSVECENNMVVKIGYMFLNFTVYPKKEKSKKVSKKKKTDNNIKKQSSISSMIKSEGISGTITYLIDIAKAFLQRLGEVASHLKIKKAFIVIGVSGEDAADTAIKCGALNAIVYPFLALVATKTKLNNPDVAIFPVYDGEGYIRLHIKLKLRLIHLVSAGIKILMQIIKINIKKRIKNDKNFKDGAL